MISKYPKFFTLVGFFAIVDFIDIVILTIQMKFLIISTSLHDFISFD